MRLLVPSGMLGGAIGTFTMLAFDTPAAGADSGVRAAGSPLATAGGQRPAKRYSAFDIETAKVLPAGTEDLLQHRPLGIACAAAVAEDREEPLIWFGRGRSGGPAPRMSRDEAARLVMDLDSLARQAYTIVTWNGLGFDFNVLGEESGLTSECQKLAAAHVDMLFHTLCQLGHLVSLEKAAEGMHLPGKKPGVSGLLAPSLWAAGKHREVIDYCVQDVRLTLSVARTCERSHRFSWVTGRGGIGALALNSGWLAVVDAERLPCLTRRGCRRHLRVRSSPDGLSRPVLVRDMIEPREIGNWIPRWRSRRPRWPIGPIARHERALPPRTR